MKVNLNEIHTVTYSTQPAIRQPPGECDPESDLPCAFPMRRFADPPDQMPATKSNIPALKELIEDNFKVSAFNQCRCQEWPITRGKPMMIFTKPDSIP
jgi:hypothetical protein